MANVLVTGANGQLGSELRNLSENLEHHFYFTDIEELDLADIHAIQHYFKGKDISHCINCAAYTAVDKAETDIEDAIAVNVTAVRNLAEICVKNKTLLIHISTDFVFDGSNCRPYIETDRPKPINVYGQSKFEGENQALKENDATIIIRTSWLYSSFGKNFVKTMIKSGREKGSVNVIFDQVGTPTYAADLAAAIMKVVEKTIVDARNLSGYYGIYHYSNEGTASWYDFAVAIFELSGITCEINPIRTEEYPTPSKRPYFSVLDKTKIKNTFSLTIPYWKDSLLACIRKLGY
jgi:dTDP-4-dehydrorhamnose reductase